MSQDNNIKSFQFMPHSYGLRDITLYNLDGKALRHYPRILPRKLSPGLRRSPKEWIKSYQNLSTHSELITIPIFYALLEDMYDKKQRSSDKEDMLEKDFIEEILQYGFIAFTGVDYKQNKVWHGVHEDTRIIFDVDVSNLKGDQTLEELVRFKEFEKPLRAIFMAKDLKKIPEVLHFYSEKCTAHSWKDLNFEEISHLGIPINQSLVKSPEQGGVVEKIALVEAGCTYNLNFHFELLDLVRSNRVNRSFSLYCSFPFSKGLGFP